MELFNNSNYGMSLIVCMKFLARELALSCPFPTGQARPFSVEIWKKRIQCGNKMVEICLFPATVNIFTLNFK